MSEQVCPECRDSKHLNCTGWALDPVTDAEVECDCPGCAVLFGGGGR